MKKSRKNKEHCCWLDTARDDLRAARQLIAGELFSHAAFACQQGAKKAVTSIHLYLGAAPRDVSILSLLQRFEANPLQNLCEQAKALDKFCIATRYPSALCDLTPCEIYMRRDAQEALSMAGLFVAAAGKIIGC
jgi:HEPN domain-containing protein